MIAAQVLPPDRVVWQWLREGRPWPFGLVGALVLVAYGVIPTLQTDPHFGRVYAAYGGASSTRSRRTAGICWARCSARSAWR